MEFKFFEGLKHTEIPDNHYIVDMGERLIDPYSLGLVRVVYHRHVDLSLERIFATIIREGHPLFNYPDVL